MAAKKFDIEELRRHLSYCPQSGEFRWTLRRGGLANAGDVAGTLSREGYVVLRLNGRHYGAHRVAYAFVHGDQPEMIDHINGKRSDNRISNLRAADCSLNMQNIRAATARSSTGVLGVSWDPEQCKFRARIVANGRRLTVGRFHSIEEASAAYLEAKRRLHAGCTI